MLLIAVSASVRAVEVDGAKGQVSVKTAAAPKPADFFSREKMDLIKELDDVMKEMIWLIRSERPVANKTLFGKVYRALQQAKGLKLTEKNKHSCDQYSIEKVSEFQYRISEHCQKHRAPDVLAKIDWSHKSASFQFQGQNYADVLGLAASLVAPTVDCKVGMDDATKLVRMDCTGFRITRADQVARFEMMMYRKGKDPLMYLKGEVLRNLLPFSDLTISVPLTGKVKILEKKKVPDRDETTPEIKAQLKEKLKQQPRDVVPLVPIDPRVVPPPVDPKNLDPKSSPKRPSQTAPPREDAEDNPIPNANDPNNDLRKNSDPDVIQIKDLNNTR